MDIRKERNILVAYDGEIKLGGFNLSNGAWIGKSGNPVKTYPKCFVYDKLDDLIGGYYPRRTDENSIYARAIRMCRTNLANGGYGMTRERLSRLEALVSVGLYPESWNSLDDTTRLSKELVSYLKENYHAEYSSLTVGRYIQEQKFASITSDPDMPSWTNAIIRYLSECRVNLPVDYLRSAIKRCAQEKAYEFGAQLSSICVPERFIGETISRYYAVAMKLFGSVKVERNFLVHLSEMLALEKKYDDEKYDSVLREKNDLPALYYEDDTFFIRPLLTRDAFHDEGEQQHNCVERLYMEKVHRGDTHVVQVRRKDNPNKSFITCEVRNGSICQWLGFANDRPSNTYGLYTAYANHLMENWRA